MKQSLLALIPFAFAAAVISLVIRAVILGRRKMAENMQRLARELGLDLQPAKGWMDSARASGIVRGRRLEAFIYATGSGKSRITWAAMSVQPASPGAFTFALQKQGFGTKIMEAFGTKEILVGEAEFDAAWFIQTNQPDFFRAALIPELRAKLMAAQRAGARGKFELKDGLVQYAEQGAFADPKQVDRFIALAELLDDLADVAEVAMTAGSDRK